MHDTPILIVIFVSHQDFAMKVVNDCNKQWQQLIGKECDNHGIAW